jgi:ABC-2 type transport system permease protein
MAGAILTGIASVVLMFAVAVPAFGVHLYASQLPAAVFSLLLGGACLSALGLAVASLVKTADQAMPVAQLTFLPLSFISGVFYPLDGAPDWLVNVANAFPLHHLVVAFDGALQPGAPHAGWSGELWPVAVWTAVGIVVATRRFSREATG